MFAVFSEPYLFAPSRRKNKFLAPFLSARHGSLRFFFLFRKIRNSIFGVPRPDKTRPPSGAVTNGCHVDRCTDGDDGEWHLFFFACTNVCREFSSNCSCRLAADRGNILRVFFLFLGWNWRKRWLVHPEEVASKRQWWRLIRFERLLSKPLETTRPLSKTP